MTDKPIDVSAEVVKEAPATQPEQPHTQAVAIRQTGGAVGSALTIDQIDERLRFIRQVMKEQMREGQDYGKIPGTGDKPSLLQPGAQKLLMTFNLREQIRKEVLREYPGFHREYEMTVTVFPSGQDPSNGWDGVGTCSTLESKYRYRKAERRCPQCHKTTIIKGKEEYGGGFVCFKKKGGCGAKFNDDDQRITSQAAEDVENEDPADCWNTVRKMAFKRALVAAAINATNTSELWTQDLEDMAQNKGRERAPAASQASRTAPPQSLPSRPAPHPAPSQAQAPRPTTEAARVPTDATRTWFIEELRKQYGEPGLETAAEFMRAAGILMPMEALDDVPLRWVPVNRKPQLEAYFRAINAFLDGAEAEKPFEPNPEPLEGKPKPKPEPKAQPELPKRTAPAVEADPEWWRHVVVPIPRKGQRKDDYLQDPDTIGSLYDLRHEQTADGQDARQRLWGFVTNFEPKPWTKRNGDVVPPSESDKAFRIALDSFAEWFAKNHPEEKL